MSGAANSFRRWRQPPHGGQMSSLLGDDGDGADLALAGGDHRADGRCLGALALRIGGVLDVRPDVDRSGARAQGGADRELRVRGVGVAHDGVGGGQQRPGAVEQQVGVGPRHRRPEGELFAQAVHELVLAREVGVGVRDALELDEGSEAVHVVEVDAHVLVEQQSAPLVDDDQRPERRVERVAQCRRVADLGQAVRARARLVAVRSHVGDQARPGFAAAGLLAQLQPPARTGEVGVALGQHTLVGSAERERALERRGRIGVTRLELDVAAWRGHAVGHSR